MTRKASETPEATEPEATTEPGGIEVVSDPADDSAKTPDDIPEGAKDLRTPADDADAPESTQEPQAESTKAMTFPEAADAIVDAPEREGVFLTETERLADKGETKGLTFAEQAEQALDQFGTGRPDKA